MYIIYVLPVHIFLIFLKGVYIVDIHVERKHTCTCDVVDRVACQLTLMLAKLHTDSGYNIHVYI